MDFSRVDLCEDLRVHVILGQARLEALREFASQHLRPVAGVEKLENALRPLPLMKLAEPLRSILDIGDVVPGFLGGRRMRHRDENRQNKRGQRADDTET